MQPDVTYEWYSNPKRMGSCIEWLVTLECYDWSILIKTRRLSGHRQNVRVEISRTTESSIRTTVDVTKGLQRARISVLAQR